MRVVMVSFGGKESSSGQVPRRANTSDRSASAVISSRLSPPVSKAPAGFKHFRLGLFPFERKAVIL